MRILKPNQTVHLKCGNLELTIQSILINPDLSIRYNCIWLEDKIVRSDWFFPNQIEEFEDADYLEIMENKNVRN